MIDALVDPGVPIPRALHHGPRHHRRHGHGARAFPEVWADLQRLARNRVVIGHNVPFDLTILRRRVPPPRAALGRPGLHRHPAPGHAASIPTLKDLDLETLAGLYQIDMHGRHTALGDALVTAELFFRMMPRLQQQGFETLGDLLRFHCTGAADIIAEQKAARLDHHPAGPHGRAAADTAEH